jgi:peptidoglycan/LPS O-acetylase OafA/YrhL
VGVDVFFVLSGFLITGLLVREMHRTGTVSLTAFYARRARRLLPAAALCLIVTVLVSAIVMPPLLVPGVAADGIATALYASNIRFAIQATDYLQAEGPPSPLLHYWSLGVEEQFYLFWPALLLLLTRGAGDLARRVALIAALVGIGSFVLSLWLTTANQPWAFFSLPTRAWELGIGALLAVSVTRLTRLPWQVSVAAGWIGLAMVALSTVVIQPTTPFPGIAALLPTVGSALVILGGISRPRMGAESVLGVRPLRFLGKISYSLYLWHWPIIVLPAYWLGTELPLRVTIGLAIVAIPVAWASQRWVEDPIRHGWFVGLVPRRNLALAGTLTVVLVASSVAVGRAAESNLAAAATEQGDAQASLDDILGPVARPIEPTAEPSGEPSESPVGPGRSPSPAGSLSPSPTPDKFAGPVPANLLPALVDVEDDKPVTYEDGCHADFAATAPDDCVYGDPNGSKTVVLVGDSHAAQWFPALERLAETNGWRLESMTKSACSAADVTVWNSTYERGYTECDQFREAVFDRIAHEHPALVVISTSRGHAPVVDGEPVKGAAGQAILHEAMGRSLRKLAGWADHVAVIADTPRAPADPPVCLSEHLDDVRACATPRGRAFNQGWFDAERATADAAGVDFIDSSSWVCPADPCPVVLGRYLVYRDTHHITTPLSEALATRLEAALPPLGN